MSVVVSPRVVWNPKARASHSHLLSTYEHRWYIRNEDRDDTRSDGLSIICNKALAKAKNAFVEQSIHEGRENSKANPADCSEVNKRQQSPTHAGPLFLGSPSLIANES
ncbi:hypothetical protein KQX54_004210 [Cotesia glomerata]|uniref:Uncharacterized protein n=1 Tax=Cotesia glomerata TaxID=32391 RepID=A0AAV7IB16_COTGL|nr:hypothetical protein KQX54_004210 [Cotesia glomerata]